jgi:hypothetical protein
LCRRKAAPRTEAAEIRPARPFHPVLADILESVHFAISGRTELRRAGSAKLPLNRKKKKARKIRTFRF